VVEFIHEHCQDGLTENGVSCWRLEKPAGYQLGPSCSVPRFVFNSYKLVGTFLFGL